jgi:hypothetical protein
VGATPASYGLPAPSLSDLGQRLFEQSGPEAQDGITHRELAGFEVERRRGLNTPQEAVQFFIPFQVGFVFF